MHKNTYRSRGLLTQAISACLLMLVFLAGACAAEGSDPFEGAITRDVNQDRVLRERAAEFRLAYAAFRPSAAYNAAAAAQLAIAEQYLAKGFYKEARKAAKKARRAFPYSRSAAATLHCYIRSFTPRYLPVGKKHKISGGELYQRINELWLRYPDYAHIRSAFMNVLEAAEAMQNNGTIIDIHAATIEEAVTRKWSIYVRPALSLYDFLARHGDKHEIGPRAKIGIARVYLIQGIGSPEKLAYARTAYINFLSKYPHHELVFTALIERAYSYLIAYRGDKYDIGVLMESAFIIKQAELYTAGKAERIALIQKLRALIRRSHQDRDFQVAQWYDDKGHEKSAIYYYKEVIQRDPDTPAAKESARALERLQK